MTIGSSPLSTTSLASTVVFVAGEGSGEIESPSAGTSSGSSAALASAAAPTTGTSNGGSIATAPAVAATPTPAQGVATGASSAAGVVVPPATGRCIAGAKARGVSGSRVFSGMSLGVSSAVAHPGFLPTKGSANGKSASRAFAAAIVTGYAKGSSYAHGASAFGAVGVSIGCSAASALTVRNWCSGFAVGISSASGQASSVLPAAEQTPSLSVLTRKPRTEIVTYGF